MSGFNILAPSPSGGDDTSKIQTGIDSGQAVFLTEGTYNVSSPLKLATPGQLIFGHSRDRTIVQATSSFSGAGIFDMTSGEEGGQLRDMKITCATTGGAVGVYAQATPRFFLNRLRITQCSIGVDARGNSGGANMDDLEMWNSQKDIWIDGSQDTMIISNCRFYSFDDSSNALINHTAINCGRCDGLQVVNSMFISVTQINLFSGTSDPFGVITGCEFDTFNGITMTAGDFLVAGCFFSGGPLSGFTVSQNISQSGGKLSVAGSSFSNAYSTHCSISGGSNFRLTGSYLEGAGNTNAFVNISGTGTIATVSDNTFNRTSGVGGTAMLNIAGGRVTAIGNRCPIDGTGKFVTVASDDWHRIVHNAAGGWTNSFPAAGSGIYSPQ